MLDNCLCITGLWNVVKMMIVKFKTMIICKVQLLHNGTPNERNLLLFHSNCPPRNHNPPNYLLKKYLDPPTTIGLW